MTSPQSAEPGTASKSMARIDRRGAGRSPRLGPKLSVQELIQRAFSFDHSPFRKSENAAVRYFSGLTGCNCLERIETLHACYPIDAVRCQSHFNHVSVESGGNIRGMGSPLIPLQPCTTHCRSRPVGLVDESFASRIPIKSTLLLAFHHEVIANSGPWMWHFTLLSAPSSATRRQAPELYRPCGSSLRSWVERHRWTIGIQNDHGFRFGGVGAGGWFWHHCHKVMP